MIGETQPGGEVKGSAPPPEEGKADFFAQGRKALMDHLWKAAAAAAVAAVVVTIAASWAWLTGGGLIRALGGVTQPSELPVDAILVIKGVNCPAPGWRVSEITKGRFLIGSGQGRNSDGTLLKERAEGQIGGKEQHPLSPAELPPHIHRGRTGPMDIPSPIRLVRIEGTVSVGGPPPGAFGASQRQVQQVVEQEYVIDHWHSFETDGGVGLEGRPQPDNIMPPWFAVTFCERSQ